MKSVNSAVLDHAVINVRYEMSAAVERFRSLGFTLTERGYHSLGSINHLMMFGHDYLELVGIERNALRVRREVVDSPMGLNGLVFNTDDADRCHRELTAHGIAAESPLAFCRPVTIGGVEQQAKFRIVRIKPEVVRGGRVYFCEHQTRDLVWRPEWQTHRNGAHALSEFIIVVPEPAREAGLYERILSLTARHVSGQESEIALDGFTIRFMTVQRYTVRYGRHACNQQGRESFMGALAVRTTALAKVRECLAAVSDVREADDVVEQSATRVTVCSRLAFDTVLEFVQ
ncbi:VOC family protein [Methylibium sp.]|uniref:VOC family protein n=1 Tax=Methylibium sp. TaxID=2067992 RepID=UPI0017B8F5EF|nr:VOC family protein [Methylibium sp.]MBA3590072.1 VOC family protein [Methylibium sp.]